jgi:hypothetical protein
VTPTKPKPFTLRIFLPDGTPDGLRIIEKSNWSGRGIVCPRALLPDVRDRAEFGKTGVYLLLGPSDAGDLPRAYIGHADPLGKRLDQHDKQKEFWTTVIFFTSKDENLNKAHVEHLEARLVKLAREARRCELENGNQPSPPSLSEMDLAEVEGFLDEVLLCFPVLGVTLFNQPHRAATRSDVLHLSGRGIEAQGYESAEGFVVLAGSRAVTEATPTLHGYMVEMRRQFLEVGVLAPEPGGNTLRLAQDYVFASPSTAAGVLLGRNENGYTGWKDTAGRTLRELRAGGEA